MNTIEGNLISGINVADQSLFEKLENQYYTTTQKVEKPKIFAKGSDIYKEGEIPKGIFYVKRGSVKVTRLGVNGRDVILRIARPDQLIGFLSLLHCSNYRTTATCLEKSEVVFFPKDVFFDLMKSDVDFANGLIHVLCDKLSYTTDELTDLVTKNVKQRLCTTLLALDQAFNGEANGNGRVVRMKKKDIASLVGTVPETLSRRLAEMEEVGILGVNERSIEILDRNKLLRISQLGD